MHVQMEDASPVNLRQNRCETDRDGQKRFRAKRAALAHFLPKRQRPFIPHDDGRQRTMPLQPEMRHDARDHGQPACDLVPVDQPRQLVGTVRFRHERLDDDRLAVLERMAPVYSDAGVLVDQPADLVARKLKPVGMHGFHTRFIPDVRQLSSNNKFAYLHLIV